MTLFPRGSDNGDGLALRERALERPLPHNADAERVVLGSCFLDNARAAELRLALEPADFYVRAHRLVCAAVLALDARGAAINPVTVAEELRRVGELEPAGGMLFLSSLTDGLPHASSLAPYFEVVRTHALAREGFRKLTKAAAELLEGDDAPADVLDRAEQTIFDLRRSRADARDRMLRYDEVASLFLDWFDKSLRGEIVATPFGIPELDEAVGGMAPEELIGVAALSGVGKSVLAKQCAQRAGERGVSSLVFSREMGATQIFGRNVAYESEVPAWRYRHGLDEGSARRVRDAALRVGALPVYVDTTTSTLDRVRARVREWVAECERRKTEPGAVWLDYMQMFRTSSRRYASRAEELSEGWYEMKRLAVDLRLPVVVLAQFNRQALTTERPMFTQVEGSGGAEKAVDKALVIHYAEKPTAGSALRSVDFFVDKNRNGPAGQSVRLAYDGEIMEFGSAGGGQRRGDDFNA